jgi:hypothetical protein
MSRNAFSVLRDGSKLTVGKKRPRPNVTAAQKADTGDLQQSFGFVACPACGKRVAVTALGDHLDSSCKGGEQPAAVTPTTAPRMNKSDTAGLASPVLSSGKNAFTKMMSASAQGSFSEEMWLLYSAETETFEWGELLWSMYLIA